MSVSYSQCIVRSAVSNLLAAVAWLSVAEVQAQHSDVLLASVGGQVAIGAINDIDGPNESLDLETRVFESVFIQGFAPPTPADYESIEPGFHAENGVTDAANLAALGASPLPGGASVSANLPTFTVNGNSDMLFYWNGVGAVDFQPIATAQPGVAFAFDPPAFGTAGVNGDLDDHPVFQVNLAGGGVPADGVYLISPTVDVTGLATSENFFIVGLVDALLETEDEAELVEAALEAFEEGAPDAVVDFGGGVMKDFAFYEEAVKWVEGNLVVPEPSALALGGVGVVAATGMRRRRRR